MGLRRLWAGPHRRVSSVGICNMTAVVSSPDERQWFRTLLCGQPHQVVKTEVGTYLYRWFLLPHNRWRNVYLHKFVRSDDPGPLHDHPWDFVSLCLATGYDEIT